eukprot:c6192_g1_i1.p1 GENE.c6192_g1_i1~~c6192_g1_i1.p1  ORF type:complete len:739 (-),score=137.91 c6192_g1_i1:763-2979(-)
MQVARRLSMSIRRESIAPDFELPATQAKAKFRYFIANYFSYSSLRITYFTLVGMVGAILIYIFERGSSSFVDCLFMAYSAVTCTGLSTVDITTWRTHSQVVLLVMVILGGQILLSIIPVVIRRQYFRQGYYAQRHSAKGHRNEVEYKALGLINKLALGINFGTQILAALILSLYMALDPSRSRLCKSNNVSPWWFSIFISFSAFNNAGFALFSDNLIKFKDDAFVLVFISILILMGNTAYPVLLRTVVYVQHKLHPQNSGYEYLLTHPRRCSTHLFPRLHTSFVAFFVFSFTSFMLITFLALDNKLAFDNPSLKLQALVGFFQAVSTRTAGFNAIDLSLVAPSMQVVYTIMMYVSSYPIISAIQGASAVPDKQKQSNPKPVNLVGPPSASPSRAHDNTASSPAMPPTSPAIGVSDWSEPAAKKKKIGKGPWSTLPLIKDSIFSDSWLLVASLFLICIAENDKIIQYPGAMNAFSILFELASGYGTVGLTLGFPGLAVSLSGKFSSFSKLVMMVVMIVARQRGLPRAIDHSVNLPRIFNVEQGAPMRLRLNRTASQNSDVNHGMQVSPAQKKNQKDPSVPMPDLVSPTSVKSVKIDTDSSGSSSGQEPNPRSRIDPDQFSQPLSSLEELTRNVSFLPPPPPPPVQLPSSPASPSSSTSSNYATLQCSVSNQHVPLPPPETPPPAEPPSPATSPTSTHVSLPQQPQSPQSRQPQHEPQSPPHLQPPPLRLQHSDSSETTL